MYTSQQCQGCTQYTTTKQENISAVPRVHEMKTTIVEGLTITALSDMTMEKGKGSAESLMVYEDPFSSILEDGAREDAVVVTAPGLSIDGGHLLDLMSQKFHASFSDSLPEPIPAAISDSTIKIVSIREGDSKKDLSTMSFLSTDVHDESKITSICDNNKPDIPLLTIDEDCRRRDHDSESKTTLNTITVSNDTYWIQPQIAGVDLLGIICDNLPINKSEYCEKKGEKALGSHEEKGGVAVLEEIIQVPQEVQLNYKNNESHTPLVRNKEVESSVLVPHAEFTEEKSSDTFHSIHSVLIENENESETAGIDPDAIINFKGNSIRTLVCQGKFDAVGDSIPTLKTEELSNSNGIKEDKTRIELMLTQIHDDNTKNDLGLSKNTCINSSPIHSTLTTSSVDTHSSDSNIFCMLDKPDMELNEASKNSSAKEDEDSNRNHQENNVDRDDDVNYESISDHKKDSEVKRDESGERRQSEATRAQSARDKRSETNNSLKIDVSSGKTLPITSVARISFFDIEDEHSSVAVEDISANSDKSILVTGGNIPSIPGVFEIPDDFIGADDLSVIDKTNAFITSDNVRHTDVEFQPLTTYSIKNDINNVCDSEKLENVVTTHSEIVHNQMKSVEVPHFGDFERLSSEIEIVNCGEKQSDSVHSHESMRVNESHDEKKVTDFKNFNSLVPVIISPSLSPSTSPSPHTNICQTRNESDSNYEMMLPVEFTNDKGEHRINENGTEWSGFQAKVNETVTELKKVKQIETENIQGLESTIQQKIEDIGSNQLFLKETEEFTFHSVEDEGGILQYESAIEGNGNDTINVIKKSEEQFIDDFTANFTANFDSVIETAVDVNIKEDLELGVVNDKKNDLHLLVEEIGGSAVWNEGELSMTQNRNENQTKDVNIENDKVKMNDHGVVKGDFEIARQSFESVKIVNVTESDHGSGTNSDNIVDNDDQRDIIVSKDVGKDQDKNDDKDDDEDEWDDFEGAVETLPSTIIYNTATVDDKLTSIPTPSDLSGAFPLSVCTNIEGSNVENSSHTINTKHEVPKNEIQVILGVPESDISTAQSILSLAEADSLFPLPGQKQSQVGTACYLSHMIEHIMKSSDCST